LGLYRNLVKDEKGQLKAVADRDGLPGTVLGDRVKLILFNPKGPAGALVFDSKVGDHKFELDTADLFGVRYLAVQIIGKAAKKGNPPMMWDSKLIPALGQTKGFTKLVVEPVLLYEGGPKLALDVDLPRPPGKDKLPELRVGDPLPLRATAIDPTGVTKAVFF